RLSLDIDRLDDRLPVDSVGDRPAHAHVVERRLVGAHVDPLGDVRYPVAKRKLRLALLQRLDILLSDCPLMPGTTVELSRAVSGQSGGSVLQHEPVDAIDPGLARAVVGWVPSEDGLHVGIVAFERKGTGADRRLRLSEIAKLLHAFARDDPGPRRVR